VDREIRNYLAYLIDLGEREIYVERAEREAAPEAPEERPQGTISRLRPEVEACRRCPLAEGRTQVVFGVGNPDADLMFVGEAPGREEDLKGEPFVGAAGRLLDRILAAMDFTREEVYIANVLKCRPPGNRDPLPEEIEACRPFLERQIECVAPRVICTLGSFAARTLLGVHAPLGRLRGRVHVFRGIDVVPTYHPAALLRHPAWKRPTWDDMKVVLRLLGKTPAHP
jgi:DNA polymerase